MTPRRGYYSLFCSSQQLTCLRLRPFSSSPRGLLLELQRYKDTVRCVALAAEVSGDQQEQLIVCLIKKHFPTLILP